MLLEVNGLVKSFRVAGGRRLVAVAGFDGCFDWGEVVGVIGESGSGKTTLGRCIAGLTEPDSGELRWHPAGPPKIGMVYQDPRSSVNPKFQLWESIADPLLARGRKRRRKRIVDEVMDVARRVFLTEDELAAFPAEVPDETIQRASLARALIIEPDLLVLDEPTTSLDADSRASVLELINRLRRNEDMSVVLITHDLRAAKYVTDRICIMYLGAVMEEGPTQALFEAPVHPYTRALLGSHLNPDPSDVPRPLELIGEIPSPLDRPPGCPLAPRCPWSLPACVESVPALEMVGVQGLRSACIRSGEFIEWEKTGKDRAEMMPDTSGVTEAIEHVKEGEGAS